ncbi:hypothetical protein IPM62_03500 [Candidatus Woesebacteria bacterium]|nr:MAG: hypothetical protein IPM62_03500 [Candidatus Woesebacteria bacterium]
MACEYTKDDTCWLVEMRQKINGLGIHERTARTRASKARNIDEFIRFSSEANKFQNDITRLDIEINSRGPCKNCGQTF